MGDIQGCGMQHTLYHSSQSAFIASIWGMSSAKPSMKLWYCFSSCAAAVQSHDGVHEVMSVNIWASASLRHFNSDALTYCLIAIHLPEVVLPEHEGLGGAPTKRLLMVVDLALQGVHPLLLGQLMREISSIQSHQSTDEGYLKCGIQSHQSIVAAGLFKR